MGVSSGVRLPLIRAFEGMRRRLGSPLVYVIPKYDPPGLTYDSDVDAWIDGDGDVVTKEPAELSYYEVPALWGADASNFVLSMGGVLGQGDVVAIAKAQYRDYFDVAREVVTGDLYGSRYTVAGLENAPDGGEPAGAAVFVVAQLRRR
jgi:hypothetical protein